MGELAYPVGLLRRSRVKSELSVRFRLTPLMTNDHTVRSSVRQLRKVADDLVAASQNDGVPDDAPVLYEEAHLTIYGTPEHYGGDKYYIKHTSRGDLGAVMIGERSALHPLIKDFVENAE